MTQLKYGKKDGITGIRTGRHGNIPVKRSAMTTADIDSMLARIEYRRKYISENEGEIIPQMLDKDSDYTPVYKQDDNYDNFIMIG